MLVNGRSGDVLLNVISTQYKALTKREIIRSHGVRHRDMRRRPELEAGPLSQWLYSVLAEAGLPVICVETRHMRAMLKAHPPPTLRTNAVARPEIAVASARSEMPKKTPTSIATEPFRMNSVALVLRSPI